MHATGIDRSSDISNSHEFCQSASAGGSDIFIVPVGVCPIGISVIETFPGFISGHGGAGIARSRLIKNSHL
jgi:hypothetical protein